MKQLPCTSVTVWYQEEDTGNLYVSGPLETHLLHSLHAVLKVARRLPVHILQPAQRLCALPLRYACSLGSPVSILGLNTNTETGMAQ